MESAGAPHERDGISAAGIVELLDWKRRVHALYDRIRAADDAGRAWREWRQGRDRLFADHPQSPLPSADRRGWKGSPFFDYEPAARVLGDVRDAPPRRYDVVTSAGSVMGFVRFATVDFELGGRALSLELLWLDGYGGGLYLPFRDATSGRQTYGAGRYLLDTAKGADLGMQGGRLVLDFNFAYNPSCSYDPRWVCPLPPPSNWLEDPIEAGERV